MKPPKASDSIFTLAFGEIYPYPGKILLDRSAVNPQTGTIKMRLTFPNKKNQLRAGMNGTVRIKNSNGKHQIIVIPYKAVLEQLGEFFVYTLAIVARFRNAGFTWASKWEKT